MPALTFITPITPAHLPLFPFAHASVQAQTVKCLHLWAVDTDNKGPGYVRNRLLETVRTPYVSFLDSDDLLEPTFAQETLQALSRRHGVYVYTDWFAKGRYIHSPDCAWINGTYHLVTAVVPTEWVRSVGGFDETLVGLEDTDFFTKLTTRGYPCCRLPIPLVHYRANGGRAAAAHADQKLLESLNAEMHRRYGGKAVSCCGDPIEPNIQPIGQKQEGDVLAQALWGGNREEFGRATGRRYPRMSWPKTVWADPRDIAISPHLWARVPDALPSPPPPPISEPVLAEVVETTPPKGLAALEAQLLKVGLVTVPPTPKPADNLPSASRARLPNVGKVKRLASVAKGDTSWPIFVMPRQPYPSYGDLWELARLSGFELIYQDEADLADARQTFIFAAPEAIPDCSHARARTILWQLEYAGDYTRQTNGDTVSEIWSSDPAHAARTGAKYVLLGSHRGLNPTLDARSTEFSYDLTMLGYMVARREAIKKQLSDYRWSPDYPGHSGAGRHQVLSHTRLMLHVHQHDTPALTPLRFALAAAYRLPVMSEVVSDNGRYAEAIQFCDYDGITGCTRIALQIAPYHANELYDLLCIERPFDKCVWEALEQ